MKSALILDRHADWQTLLAAYLKKTFDCNCKGVATIEAALRALSQSTYDLLILAEPIAAAAVDKVVRFAREKNENIKIILNLDDPIWSDDLPVIRKTQIKLLLKTIEKQTQWPRFDRPMNPKEVKYDNSIRAVRNERPKFP